MAVVRVPRTPRTSFNPARRPSALLLDQVRHLEWAALPAVQRTPGRLPTGRVKTEDAAAERIAQLTALVLEQQKVPPIPGVVLPVTLPPLPGRKKGVQKRRRPAQGTSKPPKSPQRTAARKGTPTARGARTAAGTRQTKSATRTKKTPSSRNRRTKGNR